MDQVFTFANAKGGCGKTTVALNLAICFAKAGYRTHAIDLDQQGNLSSGLGVDLNQLNMTTHRLLIGEVLDIGRYLRARVSRAPVPCKSAQKAQSSGPSSRLHI
jgi:cellulose biosynthesis protein BcsQ